MTLVEAHGTGAPLGDPIEVHALADAYGAFTDEPASAPSARQDQYRAHHGGGGHRRGPQGGAGPARADVAPSLNFSQVNRHIDLAGSPFLVSTDKRPWEAQEPRGAGRRQLLRLQRHQRPCRARGAARRGDRHRRPRPLALRPLGQDRGVSPAARRGVVRWLEAHPDTDLERAARTLLIGRTHFASAPPSSRPSGRSFRAACAAGSRAGPRLPSRGPRGMLPPPTCRARRWTPMPSFPAAGPPFGFRPIRSSASATGRSLRCRHRHRCGRIH